MRQPVRLVQYHRFRSCNRDQESGVKVLKTLTLAFGHIPEMSAGISPSSWPCSASYGVGICSLTCLTPSCRWILLSAWQALSVPTEMVRRCRFGADMLRDPNSASAGNGLTVCKVRLRSSGHSRTSELTSSPESLRKFPIVTVRSCLQLARIIRSFNSIGPQDRDVLKLRVSRVGKIVQAVRRSRYAASP